MEFSEAEYVSPESDIRKLRNLNSQLPLSHLNALFIIYLWVHRNTAENENEISATLTQLRSVII